MSDGHQGEKPTGWTVTVILSGPGADPVITPSNGLHFGGRWTDIDIHSRLEQRSIAVKIGTALERTMESVSRREEKGE